MSSIVLGMFRDTLNTLTSDDKTVLLTMVNRDDEIDRQYFLLVRLIRSTMVDKKLANALNLENIDILDYRIAANLLETAGDTIVELANSLTGLSLIPFDIKKIYDFAKEIKKNHQKTIEANIYYINTLTI